MNDRQFEELLQSVRDMGRHMRGEQVKGVRVHEVPEPEVKTIGERADLSRFAHLTGVKPRTLKNREPR